MKKTNQDIKEQFSSIFPKNHYRAIFDNMLEGYQVIGFDWKYIYINKTAAKYGRKSPEEFAGHTVMELYPGIENTEMYRALKKCMDERLITEQEFYFSYPDGSYAWFKFCIQPVPEGIFILSLDISKEKKVEETLRSFNQELEEQVKKRTLQLEWANNQLEAFSYSVSHDLRAPLRHITGFVDLMARKNKDELSEKGKHYLQMINDSAKHMGRLIDDLLSFSRASRADLKMLEVDTNLLVGELIKELNRENQNLKIDWVSQKLPKVFGDYALLRQVWYNLLENAVKYSQKLDVARIEIGSQNIKNKIVFFIQDNGIGFDNKYAHKLFGVFQRLHPPEEFEGTGIGLAIVQRIVARHGGRVWAESEPGQGARFFFSLLSST